jgi:hypothetical protein
MPRWQGQGLEVFLMGAHRSAGVEATISRAATSPPTAPPRPKRG